LREYSRLAADVNDILLSVAGLVRGNRVCLPVMARDFVKRTSWVCRAVYGFSSGTGWNHKITPEIADGRDRFFTCRGLVSSRVDAGNLFFHFSFSPQTTSWSQVQARPLKLKKNLGVNWGQTTFSWLLLCIILNTGCFLTWSSCSSGNDPTTKYYGYFICESWVAKQCH